MRLSILTHFHLILYTVGFVPTAFCRSHPRLLPINTQYLDVGIVRAQSQRFHIRANDITNPADFGVAVDFGDAGPFLVKAIL
jgi:hypothetical protein